MQAYIGCLCDYTSKLEGARRCLFNEEPRILCSGGFEGRIRDCRSRINAVIVTKAREILLQRDALKRQGAQLNKYPIDLAGVIAQLK